MKNISLLVLPLLLLTACGASATKPPSPNKTTAPSLSATPSPSSATSTTTSDNALACDSSRREIVPLGAAFSGLAKGTAMANDILPAFQKGAKVISDAASLAHGDVQTSLQSLSDDLARVRVNLDRGDLGAAATVVSGPLTQHFNAADTACKAIGH